MHSEGRLGVGPSEGGPSEESKPSDKGDTHGWSKGTGWRGGLSWVAEPQQLIGKGRVGTGGNPSGGAIYHGSPESQRGTQGLHSGCDQYGG